MKLFNFLRRKKTNEVAFVKPTFKHRLKKVNSKPKKNFAVTVGIEYNGQIIRHFVANTTAYTKNHACQKVGDGMTLKVLEVTKSKKR